FYPTPASTASLATRLALPASVTRALRTLNATDLRALERLSDLGAELDPVDAASLDKALLPGVDRLRERALVYGPDSAVRIAPGTLSALPSGWRMSDVAPEGVRGVVDKLPAQERKVLETLAAAGGVGTTRAAAVDADPNTPVARLIGQGLLVRENASTVRLPRPVRDVLTGNAPRVYPATEPALPAVEQRAVDEAAAGQGLDAVRQLRQLLTYLLAQPVALNKDATVGVRALGAMTKDLGFDPAFLITVGEAAGLIGRGNVDPASDADALAATKDALTWLDATLGDQWAILMVGWVASPWRVDTGHKLLSSEMHAPDLRHARMTILRAAGDRERLLFQAPIASSGMRDSLIAAVAAEAETVGALALGGLSTPAQALLNGSDVAAAAKALVPAEVDAVIAQADMTILAPGPLTADAARMMERFATLESPGLASVWRVTEASIRKALDSGATSDELQRWLETHVIGEVPQNLRFLVDDVARTHGSIRAGAAMSYVRSSDPTLIATAADRVDLRVLAPTVAVSDLPLPQLMAQLRSAGLQPTAEDARGAELNMVPEPSLVPATPSTLPRERQVEPAQVERIVSVLLTDAARNDEATGTQTTDAGADTIEVLRAAARARRHVSLGYVDKNGRGQVMTVLPLSVGGGQVDVLDEATDRVVRIALPRITRAVLA
ncbi:helicase-associated domain-containing protein, partial [Corynebacterium sp. Q4381]|uniref:helicase-associated domain-containing protein n=1 Tax=Corynebacterium sp. Marseille-Q4381 TaxID=3121597 RepID=UPI002FE61583